MLRFEFLGLQVVILRVFFDLEFELKLVLHSLVHCFVSDIIIRCF